MSRATLRAGAIAVAAGLAGFGLQSIAINSVQQIWPGRMITLPVAILLGPVPGVVAAAIALCTSSPGIVAAGLLEAVAIGYAARRRYSPLLVGALFWLLNGIGLALAPQAYGTDPSAVAGPFVLQQTLNGLVAVVVADLLATVIARH